MEKKSPAWAMGLALERIREEKLLAGTLTNAVSIDFVANAQLAVGGAAAMVWMLDEAKALAELGRAFYINTGTILPVHGETLIPLGRHLHEAGIPWVLDPVGIGLGTIRREALAAFKETPPTLIRANASEILALAKSWGLEGVLEESSLYGVESQDSVEQAQAAAIALARHTGGAVLVTGPVDLITDGRQLVHLAGGSPMMEQVTGFGCALGGVAALYAGCAEPLTAALAASAHFKLAGGQAQAQASGPASFKLAFLDALAKVQADDFQQASLELKEVHL